MAAWVEKFHRASAHHRRHEIRVVEWSLAADAVNEQLWTEATQVDYADRP